MNTSEVAVLLKGDVLHRKSRRWAVAALIALLITLPAIIFIKPLWYQLITLGSGAFMLAAAAWALVMAAGPVAALVCAIVALFLRVEAGFAPRSRVRRFGDVLAIGGGLLISFTPAIAALYPPVKAVLTGYIAFRGLGQQYPLAGDPHGFWQAVASWLMGATVLATLATLYWRAKWHQCASSKAARCAETSPPEAESVVERAA
ncbi:hypothetical protein Q9Q94_12410 [Uliginosibacterium sp. 31-16]|uniref:hypothetical protein n=1 Tax=Uliginosibacterium sp. 31-16 TaxID=3068315 RepID=UPI00273F9D91|nr:hypothetical protein [Uliginosibacterium sp. 31-16]MDP5240337.1 hypothetical protein [Uliginosibacterium sp. 31-16]